MKCSGLDLIFLYNFPPILYLVMIYIKNAITNLQHSATVRKCVVFCSQNKSTNKMESTYGT